MRISVFSDNLRFATIDWMNSSSSLSLMKYYSQTANASFIFPKFKEFFVTRC